MSASTIGRPKRANLTLLALILAASVTNLNLSVANVALPTIGDDLNASQTALNLVAVGYSLGTAASVLYFGALGDRHGRKLMLCIGMAFSIPAALLAAFAPNVEILMIARLLGGLSAGMAYPTTLALIVALWSGTSRVKAIALWSALGGAVSALGPLAAGGIIEVLPWGAVFLMTIPLAVVTFILVVFLVPAHVNESTKRVDNIGGVISAIFIGSVVLAINTAGVPDSEPTTIVLALIALTAGAVFVIRQLKARYPLFDLCLAVRPTFWVAVVSGIIVFGSLMGAMYIGQLFVQNVLGYTPLEAGMAILPAVGFMVVAAPVSGRMIVRFGSRTTLLVGFCASLLGFVSMLVLWRADSTYVPVGLSYALVGLGVGFAGTPSSNSLTGSVPVSRTGMASGTADLQRDLGGSIMQSILGAILSAGYAVSISKTISDAPAHIKDQVTDGIQSALEKSFGSAQRLAEQYPQYSHDIIHAAQTSFLDGADWAYLTGIFAMLIGALVVLFFYPNRANERMLLQGYAEGSSESSQQREAQGQGGHDRG
jgi:EmrB/QacA subfamily drug resistance transporter